MNKRPITIVFVSVICVLIAISVWKMYTIENKITSPEDFSYRINKVCEDDLNQDGVVEISYQSKIITTLTNQNCPIDDVHFFATIDDTVLFSILPGGLGGYMIYPSYHNIYILNVSSQKITQITKGVVGIPAVDSKRKNIAFVKWNDDQTQSLEIINIPSNVSKHARFSLENMGQVGRLLFSPNGTKIAIEVGYGPEDERGEIYIYDTITEKLTRQVTENRHLKIDGWKNENEITWSGWKI